MSRRARAGRWSDRFDGHGETIALALAAVLLAATFARPSIMLSSPQIDAVVVFDVTQSMNVEDAPASARGAPRSRLAHAKAAFEQVLGLLPCGSSLGWAIFSEHRSLLLMEPIEVCEHARELAGVLRRIDGRMAWAGNSEVAKALDGGMRLVATLPGKPALVFVSDGHEAPPISPGYRPAFRLSRGEVRGLLLGVGGELPRPIPRSDPLGADLGVWQAADVIQVDPRTLGRAGNREATVDTAPAAPLPALGATPGTEHLSSLREPYLKLLASETGLLYLRLDDAQAVYDALTDARLARRIPAPIDLRPLLAGLALLALGWPAWTAMVRGLRRARRVRGAGGGGATA